MKVQEVKGRMTAKGVEAEKMAQKLNMNPSTFYRKMKKGGVNFTLGDLMVFKEVLEMSNEEAIDLLILS
jgi:hypothetical protein